MKHFASSINIENFGQRRPLSEIINLPFRSESYWSIYDSITHSIMNGTYLKEMEQALLPYYIRDRVSRNRGVWQREQRAIDGFRVDFFRELARFFPKSPLQNKEYLSDDSFLYFSMIRLLRTLTLEIIFDFGIVYVGNKKSYLQIYTRVQALGTVYQIPFNVRNDVYIEMMRFYLAYAPEIGLLQFAKQSFLLGISGTNPHIVRRFTNFDDLPNPISLLAKVGYFNSSRALSMQRIARTSVILNKLHINNYLFAYLRLGLIFGKVPVIEIFDMDIVLFLNIFISTSTLAVMHTMIACKIYGLDIDFSKANQIANSDDNIPRPLICDILLLAKFIRNYSMQHQLNLNSIFDLEEALRYIASVSVEIRQIDYISSEQVEMFKKIEAVLSEDYLEHHVDLYQNAYMRIMRYIDLHQIPTHELKRPRLSLVDKITEAQHLHHSV